MPKAVPSGKPNKATQLAIIPQLLAPDYCLSNFQPAKKAIPAKTKTINAATIAKIKKKPPNIWSSLQRVFVMNAAPMPP